MLTAADSQAKLEVKARIAADAPVLGSPVASVECGLSDPHRGQRQVAQVTLVDGAVWYLKPRSLWPEEYFLRVWQLLAAYATPDHDTPDHDTPGGVFTIIDRGGYGWMSGVDSTTGSATDPTSYWYNTGVMLAGLHLLGVSDIHTENLIDGGSSLVPVDLECIAQPLIAAGPDSSITDYLTTDGPASVGVLPRSLAWYTPVARDMSGFHRANLPTSVPDPDGRALLAGYRDALGRAAALNIEQLLDDRVASGVRILLRSTGIYEPFVGTAAANWMERAPHLDPAVASALGSTAVQRLIEAEADCLAVGDVPLIIARNHDLVLLTASGEVLLGSALSRTSAAGVRHRARLLRQPGIVRAWLDDVELRLRQDRWPQPRGAGRIPDRGGVDRCESLAEPFSELCDRAVQIDGQTRWPAQRRGGFSGQLELRSSLAGLFDGAAGISLVLAIAAARRNDNDLAALAVDGLPSLRTSGDPGDDLSFDSGGAGIAWATAWVGALVDQARLINDAASWYLNHIPDQPTDLRMDLVDGWSGVAAAGLAIGTLDPGSAVRDRAHQLARACADLATTKDYWPLMPATQRSGVAHGITGLSMVFACVAEECDDSHLLDASQQLIHIEDGWVATNNGVGGRVLTTSAGPTQALSWAHGTAGYLIARGRITSLIPNSSEHIASSERALAATTLAEGSLGYGEAGRRIALSKPHADGDLLAANGLMSGLAGQAWASLVDADGDHALPNPLTIC